MLVVRWETILEVTLIEITPYELGCIGRQSVKFLCYVTDMLGGAIHVGSGVYVNNSHKQLWKFAGGDTVAVVTLTTDTVQCPGWRAAHAL